MRRKLWSVKEDARLMGGSVMGAVPISGIDICDWVGVTCIRGSESCMAAIFRCGDDFCELQLMSPNLHWTELIADESEFPTELRVFLRNAAITRLNNSEICNEGREASVRVFLSSIFRGRSRGDGDSGSL